MPSCLQDVDQQTGEDLNPSGRHVDPASTTAEEIAARNPDRPNTVPLIDMPEYDDGKERKAIKRISSPERWEIKQMMAASVVDVSDLPDFDEETGLLPNEDENSGDKSHYSVIISVNCDCTAVYYFCIVQINLGHKQSK